MCIHMYIHIICIMDAPGGSRSGRAVRAHTPRSVQGYTRSRAPPRVMRLGGLGSGFMVR